MKDIEKDANLNILLDKVNLFTTEESLAIPARLDISNSSANKLFEEYEYPICSWPVIINSKTSEELNKLAIVIPKLIHKIPELYFNNDKKQLADFYFEGNEMITAFAMIFHAKKMDIPCRLDLTQTENEFKILEANFGSSIGGWQIHSFEEAIRKLHKPLIEDKTTNQYQSINTQRIYIEFIVEKILKHITLNTNEVNVFIELGFDTEEQVNEEQVKEEILSFFNTFFQFELKKRNLKGSAYSESLLDLKLTNGKLFLRDKEMHCVLLMNGSPEEVPSDIFRALMMNKIYLPDHFGVSMLGDKRNLGLLRVLALQNKFEKEENELILKSIPWSNEVKACDVVYENKQSALLKLLREQKDAFVIKPANGAQGKDVSIGKFSSTEEWNDTIQIALTEKEFIAQEFCDSIHYDAPNKSNKWSPHKLIWGAFGFGDTYGGVWVRMSEVESGVNIINSANGAVEAIVFETDSEIN